ncbi:MAG: cysteine synthase A, partial [Clostridia bacterium]|nr:cysteine synthase A [Clostridia bacterium]
VTGDIVPTDALSTPVTGAIAGCVTNAAGGVVACRGRARSAVVGVSSGAVLYKGITLAKQKEYEGKTIVLFMTDTGDRYLSTENYFVK